LGQPIFASVQPDVRLDADRRNFQRHTAQPAGDDMNEPDPQLAVRFR
jgi:hypothetical protein